MDIHGNTDEVYVLSEKSCIRIFWSDETIFKYLAFASTLHVIPVLYFAVDTKITMFMLKIYSLSFAKQ